MSNNGTIAQVLLKAQQHNNHAVYMAQQDKLYTASVSVVQATNYIYQATDLLDCIADSNAKDSLVNLLNRIDTSISETMRLIRQYS